MADSACRSEEQEQCLEDSEHTSQINECAYRGKPLSESQETARVASSCTASVSLRAKVYVTLMYLAYNLSRVEVLIRNKTFGFERVSVPKIATAT